jgi:hypothetical protein
VGFEDKLFSPATEACDYEAAAAAVPLGLVEVAGYSHPQELERVASDLAVLFESGALEA